METITILLSEHQELLSRVKTLEERVEELVLQNRELMNKHQKLVDQHELLVVEHQELSSRYTNVLNDNKKLLTENARLKEKVLSLEQRLFGKKKDKIKDSSSNIRYLNKIKPSGGKRGRKAIEEGYKADEIRSYDFATKPRCNECNKEMHYVGSNDSHHEDYQITLKKVKIKQSKYACYCCNKIIVARGSKLPIDKGLPLPGLITQTILDKFSNATPLYRQAQNYGYMDINYSRQQLCNWFSRAADLVEPLVNLMFKEIVNSDYLMADETTLPLLNIKNKVSGSNGHMCIIKQGGKERFNFVYCWAIESRLQKVIEEKLSKFKGHLQSDGLSFYFKIGKQEGVIQVGCWGHVRRKHTDIVKLSGKLEGVAFEVVQKIDKLYEIERNGSKLSKEDLLALRQKESLPILKELKEYLEKTVNSASPKSMLGNAIKYTLDRFDALIEYTKDANLEIDNNSTERCIKYVVIGRKNWLFADNINSATKLAMLYSLVITCKFNKINPREYLEYIFNQLPYINKHNINELRTLLPDVYDVHKRYDLEYRERAGIVETINILTAEDIPKAA